jgi:hypothetical protein
MPMHISATLILISRYFLRQPNVVTDETQEPIVFMHGLGIGPAQYSMFISQILREFPNRPVLVPLQPHISQALLHPGHLQTLGKAELVDTLHGLLQELGWAASDEKASASKITFISHSKYVVCLASFQRAIPNGEL